MSKSLIYDCIHVQSVVSRTLIWHNLMKMLFLLQKIHRFSCASSNIHHVVVSLGPGVLLTFKGESSILRMPLVLSTVHRLQD